MLNGWYRIYGICITAENWKTQLFQELFWDDWFLLNKIFFTNYYIEINSKYIRYLNVRKTIANLDFKISEYIVMTLIIFFNKVYNILGLKIETFEHADIKKSYLSKSMI